MANTVESLRESLPEAARDLKVNLQNVLQESSLTAAQRWGVAVACAIASRNPTLVQVLLDAAREQVDASTVEALLPMIERLTRTKFTVEVGESSEGARFKILRTVEMTDAQRARIQKEMEQLEKVIASSKAQLGNDVFTSRAPAHVIDGIRNKLVDYEAQLAKLRAM